MDDIEELVRVARASAEDVVSVAIELHAAGMDIKQVQNRYVV